jgi:hypothetical protein
VDESEITIIEAMDDPNLFGSFFSDPSWACWRAYLKALFGLGAEMTDDEVGVFRDLTGRTTPPTKAFTEAATVVGRRGGKSRILALIATYLACFRRYGAYLAPGEVGSIHIIARTRKQGRVIYRFVKGMIEETALLKPLIVDMGAEHITLSNRVVIEISTASFRSARGYTLIAVLCDEIAYWMSDEDSRNPDTEILRALRPSLLTIPRAMLLMASSPYGRSGELWNAYRRYHGIDDGKVLTWQASTEVMNPVVDGNFIREEYEKDPIAAQAEYGAQFRTDLSAYVAVEALDAVTMFDRGDLPPVDNIIYRGFTDPSGGSSDSMTLAIGHLDQHGICVLDFVCEAHAPFDPDEAVASIVAACRRYRVVTLVGDRYAGEWPRVRFREHGIDFQQSARPKSDLYRDLLPLINARRVQLLDNKRLHAQLAALERSTARGGNDKIDHPKGGHDDLANSVAGCLVHLDLDRRPPLARSIDLNPPSPVVFPNPAGAIFAVLWLSKAGEIAVVYGACPMAEPMILYIVDFDTSPLGQFFLPEVHARLLHFVDVLQLRGFICEVHVPVALVVSARRHFNVVDEIPAELDPELLLFPASQHLNAGRVKFCGGVVEKARTRPFASALDFRAGEGVDDPLRAAAILSIIIGIDGAEAHARALRPRAPSPGGEPPRYLS